MDDLGLMAAMVARTDKRAMVGRTLAAAAATGFAAEVDGAPAPVGADGPEGSEPGAYLVVTTRSRDGKLRAGEKEEIPTQLRMNHRICQQVGLTHFSTNRNNGFHKQHNLCYKLQ